jgi:hypothetical protein
MATKWKVKDGTQVVVDGKLHGPGSTFSATQEEIDGEGLGGSVEKVRQQSAPKAADKAVKQPAARETKKDSKG